MRIAGFVSLGLMLTALTGPAAAAPLYNDKVDPGAYEKVATIHLRDHFQFAGRASVMVGQGPVLGGGHYVALGTTVIRIDAQGRVDRQRGHPTLRGNGVDDDGRIVFADRQAKRLQALDPDGTIKPLSETIDPLAESDGLFRTENGYAVLLEVAPNCISMFCPSKMIRFDLEGRMLGGGETLLYKTDDAGLRSDDYAREKIADMKKNKANYTLEFAAAQKLSKVSKARAAKGEERMPLPDVLDLAATEAQKKAWQRRFGRRGVRPAEITKVLNAAQRQVTDFDRRVGQYEKTIASFDPKTRRKPCGTGPGGRPHAIVLEYQGKDLGIAPLNGDLLSGKLVWSSAIDDYAKAVKRGDRHYPTSAICAAGGNGVVAIGSTHLGSLAVYQGGKQQVRALLTHGEHRFAVLRNGALVIAMLRKKYGDGTPQVALFMPRAKKMRAKAALRTAGKALKKGDYLVAVQAASRAAEDPKTRWKGQRKRIEVMIAAGWWETARKEAIALATAEGMTAPQIAAAQRLAAEARAHELVAASDGVREILDPSELLAKANEAEELAKKYPKSPRALYAAALSMLETGSRAKHLAYLEKTLHALEKSRSTQWNQYPILFDLFYAQGDAKKMARFVSRLPTDTPQARKLVYQAKLDRMNGKYLAALSRLKAAKTPTPEISALKAQLHADLGQFNDAIIQWTRVQATNLAEDPEYQNEMGVAYLRRGLRELAIKSLLGATTKDPDNATYAGNLALAYRSLDQREKSLEHLLKALGKSPDDPVLRHLLEGLSTPSKAGAAQKGRMAVLPFTTSGSGSADLGLADMLSAMLITSITGASAGEVVERARLDEVLAEQKLQSTQHFDNKSGVSVGKLLGAKRVVVGNVAQFAGAIAIDVRLVEVESGVIVSSVHAAAEASLPSIEKAVEKARAKLFARR